VNPVAAFIGAIKALSGRADWTDYFDLTRKGLQQSFIALLLTIPAFYLIAHAVQVERAKMLEEVVGGVPLAPFWLVLIVAGLFGLYLIGVIPFAVVNYIALAAFLGILLIDIRLVQAVIPFPIGAAILIGCTINAMGLVVILLGFEQVL